MRRDWYIGLANAGLRMPIGTDLVLRERGDADAVLLDGHTLGEVVVEAARRYDTPLAMPVMDLTVEKAAMLDCLGVPAGEIDSFHFRGCPGPELIEALEEKLDFDSLPRARANCRAIATAARHKGLTPVGMSIGPFSLLTKLLADPITPVYLAGAGATGDQEPEVEALEAVLEMATRTVLESVAAQIDHGARAVVICEPAANKVFFSPTQLEQGSDIFERFAMRANRRVAGLVREKGADLIFHCCGELTEGMVHAFTTLEPVVLSLGSSRRLWEDAAIVSRHIVLYGNLPSKKFYDDKLVSVGDVQRLSAELIERMASVRHPFILGTECDVLSVPGCEQAIKSKVNALLHAGCAHAH